MPAATARPRPVVPVETVTPTPDGWWKADRPGGFDARSEEDLQYLAAYGVTRVRVGRKTVDLQTADQALWRVNRRSADPAKMPPPYPRHRASPLVMGCGGKGKPRKVIDRGEVKEYVGIGWVPLGPAEVEDYHKYPELTVD